MKEQDISLEEYISSDSINEMVILIEMFMILVQISKIMWLAENNLIENGRTKEER